MSIKREQLSLDRGEERAADGSNFDVTAWREQISQNTSNGADFLLEVAKGKVPGHSFENIEVETNNIGPSFTNLWDSPDPFVWPTAGEALELVSTSVNDVFLGTGGNIVRVIGLDANYLEVTEDVQMNGLTPVATVRTDWLTIYNIVVIFSGTSQTNEGDITLNVTGGGNLRATALAGNSNSFNSQYTVPAGKSLFWMQNFFWTPKGEDAIVRPSVMIDTSNTWSSGGGFPVYQAQTGFAFKTFLRVPEKSSIKWEAKGTNPMQAGYLIFDFMVIDNDLLD